MAATVYQQVLKRWNFLSSEEASAFIIAVSYANLHFFLLHFVMLIQLSVQVLSSIFNTLSFFFFFFTFSLLPSFISLDFFSVPTISCQLCFCFSEHAFKWSFFTSSSVFPWCHGYSCEVIIASRKSTVDTEGVFRVHTRWGGASCLDSCWCHFYWLFIKQWS